MGLPIKDMAKHQETLLDLVYLARERGMPKLNPAFVTEFTKACEEGLTDEELAAWNKVIQQRVKLPIYTPTLAAAWAGVGFDAIRTALWKEKSLDYWKPGHDVFIWRDDLEEWVESRN